MSSTQQQTELLAALVESFTEASSGGYCGQTHIHKAAFIAQELLGVPFGLKWEMYTYGPFSRDVRPGLARCEQEGMVVMQRHSNGLRIRRAAEAPPSSLPVEFRKKLQLVAQHLAPMDRGQLEKVATAAWVTRSTHGRGSGIESRAVEVHKLKPHIDTEIAEKAVSYVDDLISGSGVGLGTAALPDPVLMRQLAAKTAELYPSGGSLAAYRPGIRARVLIAEIPKGS